MDKAFAGLTGFNRIVDDIVIYDSDAATFSKHVRQLLKHCADQNIVLNLYKLISRSFPWGQHSMLQSTSIK